MIDQEPRGQGFTEAWVEAALSVGVLAVVEAAAGGRGGEAPGGRDGGVEDQVRWLVRDLAALGIQAFEVLSYYLEVYI